jgi:hypothetical protein
MLVSRSETAQSQMVSPNVNRALGCVSRLDLEQSVRALSIPRNFISQPRGNRRTADWIASRFRELEYDVSSQGPHCNIVAMDFRPTAADEMVLVGAHYDSVACTPGADDNASGVASMLSCAKALSMEACRVPVCFVAFNREEEGLLGSSDFVRSFLLPSGPRIREAHILEMVGYCRHDEGSQGLPRWIPRRIGTRGNFLGVLGNRHSGWILRDLTSAGRTYLPGFPVRGLKVLFGIERYLPALGRSDQFPFWQERQPTVMWTDTAEFRNPNYHTQGDSPDTLDYAFLEQVTKLLTAHVLTIS